jgi:hypothetical protein
MALTKKEFFSAHLLSGMLNHDHIDMTKKVDLAVRYAEQLAKKLNAIQEKEDQKTETKSVKSKN